MRVLQVIDTLNAGGAERMVVLLSNLLFENGIDVTVMILVEDGSLVSGLNSGIPVLRLHRKTRFEKGKMQEYNEILKEFTIVHTHLKHNYRYTRIVASRYGLKGTKLIFHDHSHNLVTKKLSSKYAKDLLFKNVLKPRFYIGVSMENCRWSQQKLGVNKEHCYLLENVVE